MAGYVMLMKFTQQGITDVKESPKRIDAAKALAEKMGIQVVGVWVTMGAYDLVAIGDAPDDQTMGTFALALGSAGNVSTQTMRAFSEEEYKAVVGKLP
jgi:uncharacterized protein with GYD domain